MSYVNWFEIKNRIKCTQSRKRGILLLEDLDTNLTEYTPQKLSDLLKEYKKIEFPTLLDNEIKNKLEYLIKLRNDYYIRTPYHNVLSIKLVLPVLCQASCKFCYYANNTTYKMESSKEIKEKFLNNFIGSLKEVIDRSRGKVLSLDITGGEPTIDLDLLKSVMSRIKDSGLVNRFSRITLTSNGYQALESIPIISGVVDYLNISLHSTIYDERVKRFNTDRIPNNSELDKIIYEGYKHNIKVSSVFVLDDITKSDFDEINDWCARKGFVTNRLRFNVYNDCHKNKYTRKLVEQCLRDSSYSEIYSEECEEADYSILAYKNNMLLFIMDGIPETYSASYGIEVLIRCDGLAYIDYRGDTLLKDVPYLPINYVLVNKNFDKITKSGDNSKKKVE